MQKYLIKTAGRTGSHKILEYFHKHGFKIGWIRHDKSSHSFSAGDIETADAIVIHCHNLNLIPPDHENWFLINSFRRNKLDQYCSNIVANYTNQWSKYDSVTCDELTLDLKDFEYHHKCYTYFQKAVQLQRNVFSWKGYAEIPYEYIESDFSKLIKLNDVSEDSLKEEDSISEKSPWNYKKIFTNYDIAKKVYNN